MFQEKIKIGFSAVIQTHEKQLFLGILITLFMCLLITVKHDRSCAAFAEVSALEALGLNKSMFLELSLQTSMAIYLSHRNNIFLVVKLLIFLFTEKIFTLIFFCRRGRNVRPLCC